jgi:uncharacterized protein YegL
MIRSLLIGLILLVGAASTVSAQDDVYYDNVVIILDASGSMDRSMSGTYSKKMDVAKQALKSVLNSIPQSTHIGLLVFSGANIPDHWVYPLGYRNDRELMRAIDLPLPNGGTPLGEYIKIGADRLLEERERQYGYGSYRLIVVTDGEAEDHDLVNLYTPLTTGRGITMDVIGVDMEGTHTLATKVHSYRRANDPQALRQALAEIFAEVGSTDSNASGEDAFSELSGIPLESATAMLQALSLPSNKPISVEAASPASMPGSPSHLPGSGGSVPAPSQPIGVTVVGGLLFVIAALAILIKVARKS